MSAEATAVECETTSTPTKEVEELIDEVHDVEENEEEEEDKDKLNQSLSSYYGYDDMDLPPLRVQAGKATTRRSLTSSASPLQTGTLRRRRSLDCAYSRTRSRSPSSHRLRDYGHGSVGDSTLQRSFSELEEFVDPDILYDSKGLLSELDVIGEKEEKQRSSSARSLTMVVERMSEEALEDIHAFSDLTVNSNTRASCASVGGSTWGGDVCSHILAPLNEYEDEDDISDQEYDENEDGQIILTNMEKIAVLENEPLLFHKYQDAPSVPTEAETLPISVQTDAKTSSVKSSVKSVK